VTVLVVNELLAVFGVQTADCMIHITIMMTSTQVMMTYCGRRLVLLWPLAAILAVQASTCCMGVLRHARNMRFAQHGSAWS